MGKTKMRGRAGLAAIAVAAALVLAFSLAGCASGQKG